MINCQLKTMASYFTVTACAGINVHFPLTLYQKNHFKMPSTGKDVEKKSWWNKLLFFVRKSKKDTILKQQLREKKKKEKVREGKKEEESYEKTIKNADEFQKWVENKGKPRKRLTPPTLTQR